MFNPYHARPIGSKKFENHLLTLMVQGIETQKTVREAIPQYPVVPKAVLNPERYKADPVDQGWHALYTAILSLALIDYLDNYFWKIEWADADSPKEWVFFSRCVELENEYFRQDEDRGALLDSILAMINSVRTIQEKKEVIRNLERRISYISGYTGGIKGRRRAIQ